MANVVCNLEEQLSDLRSSEIAYQRSLAESQYVHATSIARFGSHDSETQGEHQMF